MVGGVAGEGGIAGAGGGASQGRGGHRRGGGASQGRGGIAGVHRKGSPKCSLRSKRFRLVSGQRNIEEGDFRF